MRKQPCTLPAIAIVGIGGIFPQAATLDKFWDIIKTAHCAASEPPTGRWHLPVDEVYHSEEGTVDCVYSKKACFIDKFSLDLPFEHLHIDKPTALGLDPLFQLLLQAGHQAFTDAKMTATDPQRVGIIVGNLALPSETASQLAEEYLGRTFSEQVTNSAAENSPKAHPLNRFMTGLPAAVLAKALGLGGRCHTLDAACASSLYAIKLAVDELQSGRADAMLSGGVARPDSQYTQMGFSQLHALSPTGICAPFDQNGNGLVVGEGSGVVVLKRTEDALRDGDHIYAQIAGIGLSNDIGGSLLAPISEGQLRAMRAAYTQANWQPQDIDHIECHATGTPVGDAVEFESLKQLWANDSVQPLATAKCVLGSVKSNIGHLLTAAGSAALLKTLLALKNQVLPPTAGYHHSNPQWKMEDSPFAVLSQPQAWSSTPDRPRRAAVSAFGFGGINAHILLEEWCPETHSSVPQQCHAPQDEAVAIIGMDIQLGPWSSLAEFSHQVLSAEAHPAFTAPHNWCGAPTAQWFKDEVGSTTFSGHYLSAVDVVPGQFRIPPTELKEMLPRQALMLKCGAQALKDAGLDKANHTNSGVFIGNGLDLNATNFSLRWSLPNKVKNWATQQQLDLDDQQLEQWQQQLQDAISTPLTANRTMGALGSVVASRIAREFKFGGPSFTIACEENSGMQALHTAVSALQRGEIDNALVGAVDLPGDIRAQLSQFKLGQNEAIAEGACALILKPLAAAQADNDKIYAVIDGTSSNCHSNNDLITSDASAFQRGFEQLCTNAKLDRQTIGYLDICAHSQTLEQQQHAAHKICSTDCQITSSTATIGHSGEASGLVGVIQAALALHHCVLPPATLSHEKPQWSNRYWLHNRQQGPRRAIVSNTGAGGVCNQTLLSHWDNSAAALPANLAINHDTTSLFCVFGNNAEQLEQQLQQLQNFAVANDQRSTPQLAAQWYADNKHHQAELALSLISTNQDELRQQIEFSINHLHHNPTQRLDGRGGANLPACAREKIFYAPQPLGKQLLNNTAKKAEIAFVFPGSGNHFHHMGQALALQWPAIFEQQHRQNLRLKDQYQPQAFWGTQQKDGVSDDHNAMIIAHVALCTALSDTARNFAIEPQAAIGYSLGESSSLFSLNVWDSRDEMLNRIEASTLFTTDLAGPCNAAHQLWQLNADQQVDWCLGIVPLPAAQVRTTLQQYEHVYLLIINTPQECIIGGNRAQVELVVDELNCHFIELHGVTTVHCPVTTVVGKSYRNLHLFPTRAPAQMRFYSCASGNNYSINSDNCADAILAQATDTIDFTRVINNAYADGVRIFVETGSGTSCSRMIQRILGDKPHMVRPTCQQGRTPLTTWARLLGQLIAERVACDPSALFEQIHQQLPQSKVKAISLTNGKEFFSLPPQPQQILNSFEVSSPQPEQPQTPIVAPEPQLDSPLLKSIYATQQQQNSAHTQFLTLSDNIQQLMARNLQLQQELLAHLPQSVPAPKPDIIMTSAPQVTLTATPAQVTPPPTMEKVAFDREMCMEFAVGSIAKVLGAKFADIDAQPTRVRLPDEPLMLVDRIIRVEGEPCSMSHGLVITEHDVTADRWYLDGGRIPTCVAVEAGQADLFLSGYLGIDKHTKGLAVYRLLDAVVQFHQSLPQPGDTIRYVIRIEKFFRQGDTWLFRFDYDCTVGGKALMTMRNGCAGFFTKAELDAGQGIIHTKFDLMTQAGKRPDDWQPLVAMTEESYTTDQIKALRGGDLVACFGSAFALLNVSNPYTLPSGHMELVDSVAAINPSGGRFGLGQIKAQMKIQPDDWFLTCHFCDDHVMPGTLMYECCLHTLRIYLMRMGWVSAKDEGAWEPVPGIDSQLKCRGQVTEKTTTVTYEVTIKELGYRPQPYAIVDALMYADSKPIVEITNMSVQISGLNREKMFARWTNTSNNSADSTRKPALFDNASILAYAEGNPSQAFGEPYRPFDSDRVLARLPRPPFKFIDRITAINTEPWKMVAGGSIEAQYDIPRDAWYFSAARQAQMPFSVLLEIALQPCGWMAAYVGSALTSTIDLCFRNLDGNAVQLRPVTPDSGTLTIDVDMTRVSSSGGMIIQSYDFCVSDMQGPVYRGDTVFGFFSKQALANQIGIRDVQHYQLNPQEMDNSVSCDYPQHAPYPDVPLQMIDEVTSYCATGGKYSLGYICGTKTVNPQEWFFKAHFYQDPVCPGSLGLESYQQLLQFVAIQRWGTNANTTFEPMTLNQKHTWMYRGQIIQENQLVTVEATIKKVDDSMHTLWADGLLSVDGKVIYQMTDFGIRMQG